MPCPGYPQTRDLIFRHETLKTVRRASAGAFFEAATVLQGYTGAHTLTAGKKRVISLPVHDSLRLSDTVTATCYFIHQLVIPVDWFPLIPKLY